MNSFQIIFIIYSQVDHIVGNDLQTGMSIQIIYHIPTATYHCTLKHLGSVATLDVTPRRESPAQALLRTTLLKLYVSSGCKY